MDQKPHIVVFASGSKDGGGSGFEKLVKNSRTKALSAQIVAVVSNHETGGVCTRARQLGVPFIHFPGPWTAERYQQIFALVRADFTALSGWLKLVSGLDPRTTINIHPGPLPRFGGYGMHGHHVHEAVMKAYRAGEITHSAVCMHFVTSEYDRGPVFFRRHVRIDPDDTPESLAARVNAEEHAWQSVITNLVVTGRISWNGSAPKSLKVPCGYSIITSD